MKTWFWVAAVVWMLSACSYRPDPVMNDGRKEVWKVENGDSVLYIYEGDVLSRSYTVKENLKVGPCKTYYPSGKVKINTDYEDGMKHGKSLYYYENGNLFRETEYRYNDMHGVRKIFFENGQLQAEIPYEDDHVIPGTREWKEDGTEIEYDYKILLSEKDNTAFTNEFVVTLRLNDKKKKVSFYEDRYDSGDMDSYEKIETRGNVGTVKYTVQKGDFIMRKVTYYALLKSKMGNPIMLKKTYNLSVEN